MKIRSSMLLAMATSVLMLAAGGSVYAAAVRAPGKTGKANPLVVAAGSGLKGTSHDFSNSGNFYNPIVNPGICSYCHTPHHAISTLLLWNQTLSKNTFSWDVPATTAGTTFPSFAGNTYGGPTAKCLSCHDGSVAWGDFNWFNEQGEWNGTKNPYAVLFIGKNSPDSVGYGGAMKGNHPVAMPYPYGGQANKYNGVTNGLNTPTGDFSQFQTTPVAPVRIYTDVNGDGKVIQVGGSAGKSGMECSSCHDPHNKINKDVYFLLGSLSGNDTDYICLKCHIK